jgi:uncharacterized protein YjeT (DUF2065 family)
MDAPNPNSEAKKPKQPAWPVNLGIGLATGIILGMLIASWGLRQENWQKAGWETVAAVMLVVVFLITAIVTSTAAFVRNGFRCSRWALVIALSILALVLVGLWPFLRPILAKRAMLAKLTAAGAHFECRGAHSSGVEILLGHPCFRDVYLINWDCSSTPRPDFACLHNLSSLQFLDLTSIKSPPTDLEPLKSLPSLESLGLQGCELSDTSWECIRNISSLKRLDLYDTQINSSELKQLAELPRLNRLTLDPCGGAISDDELAALGDLSNLTILRLVYARITDQGLMHLGKLTKLRYLDLRDSEVSDKAVQELQKTLPNCTIQK